MSARARVPVNLLVIAVGALLFVLFAFIIAPVSRRARHEGAPASAPNAPEPQNGWLDVAEAPAVRGEKSPPVNLKLAVAGSPEFIEKGRNLFAANCAACHGAEGKGNGLAAPSLNTKPRDFSSRDGWKNGMRLTQVFRTITTGIAETAMASFDTLPAADRFAVAHFVQKLGSFDHGEDDAAALAALDRDYSLSTGAQGPSRVPVSTAMARLAAEHPDVAPLIMPAPDDSSAGAQLLRRVVQDPQRAARTLAGLAGWRGDSTLLVKALAAGAPGNGFSTKVALLDESQWKSLAMALQEERR